MNIEYLWNIGPGKTLETATQLAKKLLKNSQLIFGYFIILKMKKTKVLQTDGRLARNFICKKVNKYIAKK